MKILIVTSLYPPYCEGGYELNCKAVADELTKRGHEIFILTRKEIEEKAKEEKNIFRLLYMCNTSFSNSIQRRYKQLKWAYLTRRNYLTTYKLAKQLKPDLVYVWQLSSKSMLPLVAIQKLKIPIVFHLGDYWLSNSKLYFVFEPNRVKRLYRSFITGIKNYNNISFNHLLVVSNALKREYERTGFNKNNITIISRGVPSY